MLGTPFDPNCEKCRGYGYIAVEHATHTDLVPCKCVGTVNSCTKGHAAILFSGTACPLCAALAKNEKPC